MGITKSDTEILFYSKRTLGVSFSRTLTLGRLQLFISKENIEKVRSDHTPSDQGHFSKVMNSAKYAEPLFELLGADHVESLDFSDYEGATIIHDLNDPIPQQYHNSFSAVVDGGTIEHVFNFPVAIRNCIDCLDIGGTYIGITPANNQMGHGFYQFSPELYFRVFSPENGFEIQKVFLNTNGSIYEVADPLDVRSRVELTNSRPAALIVIAKKIKNVSEFHIPQQSDYVSEWVVDSSIKTGDLNEGSGVLMNYYRKLMPKRLKIIFRNLYDMVTKEKFDDENLGTIDPRHFKKVDLVPNADKAQ